jgi:amidase
MRRAVSDVPFQPAVEQSRALAAGAVSSRELVELYLERIATHNPVLNAVVTLDAERARREAGEADAVRAAGRDLGPLHGVPITVKDSFETAGMRTVCGRTDLKDYVPDQDAEAVKRLSGGPPPRRPMPLRGRGAGLRDHRRRAAPVVSTR